MWDVQPIRLDELRDRLGDDHEVGADGEGAAEVPLPRRPRAVREHDVAGAHGAARRDDPRTPPGLHAHHRRALEDAHAALEQHPPELARELARLQHREVRRDHAADEARRVCDEPRLGGVHAPQPAGVAVLLQQPEGLVVGPGLPVARPGVQDALMPGVDSGVVPGDPAVELVHHGGEGGGVGHAALLSQRGAQTRQHGPGRREEAAVGAAAAGADDVGLDERDAEVRVALAELVGGPEAGEPAADDADVGGHLAGQRRAQLAGVGVQRLFQPPAARCHRRHHRPLAVRRFRPGHGASSTTSRT